MAEVEHHKQVEFIKILSHNWESTIPQMLEDLDEVGIGINLFFKLERSTTFKFASFLSDVNISNSLSHPVFRNADLKDRMVIR